MRIPQKPPPNWREALVERANGNFEEIGRAFEAMLRPDVQEFVRNANESYYHWDRLRHCPLPDEIDPLTAWAAIQNSRAFVRMDLPISFTEKANLKYCLPPRQQEQLHEIALRAGGNIGTRYHHQLPGNEAYLFNSLMEEAIASSQLEGACTTRKIAKQMLRSNRKPRDKAELMILNNYKAILEIRDLKSEKLTPRLLCHLQEILTEGTLDNPQAAGRFRLPDEYIVVEDTTTGEALYVPPPADSIERRIEQICDFANTKTKPWVHPVVKAMVLHFALGFVHPFVDGNGRTARAVFYWYMLKSGYWLFEFLPISRVLVSAPAKYARAFLYTETDHGDVTYFNHYHLNIILRAINDLHDYLEREQLKIREAETLLESFHDELNHRQRALISHALKHPSERYTARLHEGRHHVTYATARSDLMELEKLGLLKRSKREKGSKEWLYYPAENLIKLLKSSRGQKAAQGAKLTTTFDKKIPQKAVVATVLKEHPAPQSLFGGLFD